MGGRELPPRVGGVIMLMAPALLAALVVSSALADGEHLHVGADTAGVAAGAAVLVLTRAGVLTSVLVAAVRDGRASPACLKPQVWLRS